MIYLFVIRVESSFKRSVQWTNEPNMPSLWSSVSKRVWSYQ